MKILLATLLVGLGQAALAQDQIVEEFAGCYELRVERSKYVFENYGHQFLPKGLELTAERGALGRFAVRGFDSKTRSDLPLSSWRVKDDGTVDLEVSTGFVGCISSSRDQAWSFVVLLVFGLTRMRDLAQIRDRVPSKLLRTS